MQKRKLKKVHYARKRHSAGMELCQLSMWMPTALNRLLSRASKELKMTRQEVMERTAIMVLTGIERKEAFSRTVQYLVEQIEEREIKEAANGEGEGKGEAVSG